MGRRYIPNAEGDEGIYSTDMDGLEPLSFISHQARGPGPSAELSSGAAPIEDESSEEKAPAAE